MVQLAALIACHAVSEYRVMLGAALTIGVTPVQVKEIVYQAVPYAGMAKVFGSRPSMLSAPQDEQHIQRWLSAGCFGDHLTRTGLDVPTRELLTFAMLASLDGCEPQLAGHVAANLNVGNDRGVLLAVLTQLIPYIGYPRTLNALRVLDEATLPRQ